MCDDLSLNFIEVDDDMETLPASPHICDTVKPVYNNHLYNKIYYLWFIPYSVLMKTESTNLLLLTISAFWSSSRWPLAT